MASQVSADGSWPIEHPPEPYTWISELVIDVHVHGLSYSEAVGETKVKGMDLFFLDITNEVALVLSSAKHQNPKTKLYERVGIVGMYHRDAQYKIYYQETVCKMI
jgi:hypothetical protein